MHIVKLSEEAVRNKLMESDKKEGDINERWQLLKETMKKSAESVDGQSQQTKQKTWISDKTFQLVERKRQAKCSGNKTEYSMLRRVVQRNLRRDRNADIEATCTQLEDDNRRGNMSNVFRIARKLTSSFKPRFQGISAKDGKLLTETEDILGRWKEYCEDIRRPGICTFRD